MFRYAAISFPWREARKRFAREVLFQIRIRIDSWMVPFFAGLTSGSCRPRASNKVVLPASFRETNTPRTISDSTVESQASASVFVWKVFVLEGCPYSLNPEPLVGAALLNVSHFAPHGFWDRFQIHWSKNSIFEQDLF